MPKRYTVYLNGQGHPQRLGTVTAPDRDAAIKKAIERYDISETSKLDLVLVMPPKSKRIKVRRDAR